MTPCIGIVASGMLAVATASGPELEPMLPDVATPPGGETQWISEHMSLNGLPMSLKTFTSPLDIDDLFRYYESWGRSHHIKESKRMRRDDWQVLGLKSMHHFVSIQARQTARGSEGTIAVSSLPDAASLNITTLFPHPASVKVVNLQQYQDRGLESEHISMVSFRSIALEARAFSEILTRNGWQLLRDGPAATLLRGHVIEAQRGGEHALMTLQPDRARPTTTAIVIIWRKS
jgi:hypothetical protein